MYSLRRIFSGNARGCQWVFAEPLRNAYSNDVKFCRRQRVEPVAQ